MEKQQTKAVYGKVELENGLILDWLRFSPSEEEAIRVVRAQHVHVKDCWIVEREFRGTDEAAQAGA